MLWAPSTKHRTPFECASCASSFAGRKQPVLGSGLAKWMTRVRWRQLTLESCHDALGVLGRDGELDFLHHQAVALGLPHPGFAIAGVFEGGDQDLVSLAQIQALAQGCVSLGGVARNRELIGRDSEKRGGLHPYLVDAVLKNLAVFVRVDCHQAPVFGHRIINRFRCGSESAGIHVGQSFFQHEFLAHLLPVPAIVTPVLAPGFRSIRQSAERLRKEALHLGKGGHRSGGSARKPAKKAAPRDFRCRRVHGLLIERDLGGL